MKKLLFIATHPKLTTGYGYVGNKVSNYLAKYFEVHYFGFQYDKNISTERIIDENITLYDAKEMDTISPAGFGDLALIDLVKHNSFDYILIYNDVKVILTCHHHVKDIKGDAKMIAYLDIVYPFETTDIINELNEKYDKIITFTNFWKTHLRDIYKINENKLFTLYHGIDEPTILDQNECKIKIGLKETDFLIVNLNRNSCRKQLGICVSGYLKFLKGENDRNKYKLWINRPYGEYNVIDIIKTECLILDMNPKQILAKNFLFSSRPNGLSDEEVNMINNASDIIINTSSAEGFGLVALQGIVLGKKILITELPIYYELYQTLVNYLKIKMKKQVLADQKVCGIEYLTCADEVAYKLKLIKDKKDLNPKSIRRLTNKFLWKNILNEDLINFISN